MSRPASPIAKEVRMREYRKAYKLKHPDRIKESKEKWRKANLNVHAEHSKKWRDTNPEKAKAVYKSYAQRNPDKIYLGSKKRRAALKGVPHEPYNRMEIYAKFGGTCHLCLEIIDLNYPAKHPMSLSLDHIVPISKGGHDVEANLAPAHYGCNSRKGNRL